MVIAVYAASTGSYQSPPVTSDRSGMGLTPPGAWTDAPDGSHPVARFSMDGVAEGDAEAAEIARLSAAVVGEPIIPSPPQEPRAASASPRPLAGAEAVEALLVTLAPGVPDAGRPQHAPPADDPPPPAVPPPVRVLRSPAGAGSSRDEPDTPASVVSIDAEKRLMRVSGPDEEGWADGAVNHVRP
eukprot:CAMPEP_0182857268 /NCGR_PEP_ID=MMETSP0034_2-20130328/2945_1 /TAXON_ID=156128 /ORGANISM="Nephroselmis pyriformis, Strain CCMP717" /LENGTH=184 /DNA_ID=CAMNT_0024988481 /DNA_START=403 /DNA_END=958 /DNA_ORIENTATION=+